MLKQAVVKCPASLWNDPADKNKFWHIAYHALFYTHLYLQPSEQDFEPWAKHREQSQLMGPRPRPAHQEPEIGEPYSKEEVLEYLEFCQKQVSETMPSLECVLKVM
ncbi:MAG: hypothetical protein JXM69_05530 [Anaerolineae bacterium]|nr:hypothetical protein [Anaerolineae bacterium]